MNVFRTLQFHWEITPFSFQRLMKHQTSTPKDCVSMMPLPKWKALLFPIIVI